MSNDLVKLEDAARMLAQISTAPEAIALIDMAEVARVYARQAKLGLEAQNHAAEIKLRAQRKAGEILADMEKNSGASEAGWKTRLQDATAFAPPTYADMGINKVDAHRYQSIAALPDETFEEYIAESKSGEKELTTAGVLRVAKEQKRDERTRQYSQVEAPLSGERYRLIHGDITNALHLIEPNSIDAIITDPPYPAEYVPLYEHLAQLAAHALKDGGSLICMTGQSYLPAILNLMTPYIPYHWMVSYLTPGGQAVQLWKRNVNTFWKPVIWFVKGEYRGKWIGDVSKSDVNNNDKRFHHWGQSESGMSDLVKRFSNEGDVILDPFVGGGTTGVVCLSLGRRFIGIDLDEKALEVSAARMEEIE